MILLGAAVAFVADTAVQYFHNRSEGLPPLEAIYHENLNMPELVGAAVGGAVSSGLATAAMQTVPQAVNAIGLSGATGTATTIGGGILVGAGSNVIGDFSGRLTENSLGSERSDILDPGSYGGAVFWGGVTGGAAATINLAVGNEVNSLNAGAQESYAQSYRQNMAIQAWDGMMLNGGEGWLQTPEGLGYYSSFLFGPPEALTQEIVHPAASTLAALGRAADILFNDDLLEATWEILDTVRN